MALTEHKCRMTRRLRCQYPWNERRRSDSSARCSAVEKTSSHAAGRAARQESPAIHQPVRTSGIHCSARRKGVQAQPERQAVSTAVSTLSFPSAMKRSRSISKAFRSWECIRSLSMRLAGFLRRTLMLERGRRIPHRSSKPAVHKTFPSR